MKKKHILSLALVGQLGAIPALAQGSGKDVTIFNEAFRESAQRAGYELPEGRLKSQSRVFDYSVNGDLGIALRQGRGEEARGRIDEFVII